MDLGLSPGATLPRHFFARVDFRSTGYQPVRSHSLALALPFHTFPCAAYLLLQFFPALPAVITTTAYNLIRSSLLL